MKATVLKIAAINMVMQGMVDRAVLLSALAEVKMYKDTLQAKEKELAWLEEQLLLSNEQVEQSRKEIAQVHAESSSLVSRCDLDTAKACLQEAENTARGEIQKQRDVIIALNGRLNRLEEEKNTLVSQMQVLRVNRIVVYHNHYAMFIRYFGAANDTNHRGSRLKVIVMVLFQAF